jgi:hypothetical protein
MAASLCGQEIAYIRAILRDFRLSQSQPTLVYDDNLACKQDALSSTQVFSDYLSDDEQSVTTGSA